MDTLLSNCLCENSPRYLVVLTGFMVVSEVGTDDSLAAS